MLQQIFAKELFGTVVPRVLEEDFPHMDHQSAA